MKIASMVFALLLIAGSSFAAEDITAQFNGTVFSQDDGTVCFSQLPGTCDGGTFVSAIVSMLNVTGTNCGTYTGDPPTSRTADEYVCDGDANGMHWWGTHFGNGWDPATCPLMPPYTFNFIWYVGGVQCPDDAAIICSVDNQLPDNTIDLGDNDFEYDHKFTPCAPAGIWFVTVQINSDAYPQWGWVESADNLVGAEPCLIAPGLGVPTWTPLPLLVGVWCGQSMEIQAGGVVPTYETTWGAIKSTFR